MSWKRIKAVLDTNIHISALFWKGKQDQIIQRAVDSRFRLITSAEILAGLAGKLREKFNMEKGEVNRHMQFLINLAVLVEPAKIPNIVEQGPSDDKIIAKAVACWTCGKYAE